MPLGSQRSIAALPLAVSVFFLVFAASITAALYTHLPNPYPLFWYPDGTPHLFVPLALAAFFLPLIGFVASIAIGVLLHLESSEHGNSSRHALQATIAMPTLILTTVHLITAETYWQESGSTVVVMSSRKMMIGFALLTFCLSSIVKRLEPNSYIGLVNPWTLEDQDVWTKTHLLAGKLFLVSTVVLAFIASADISSVPLIFTALLSSVLLPLLASVIYSYAIRVRFVYTAHDWDAFTGAQPLVE